MAVAYRSASSATGSTTSLSVTKPTGTVDNDILVAFVSYGGGTILTAPSGWTSVREVSLNANNKLAVYHKVAASEPASQNWALNSANQITVCVVSASGGDTSAPINVHGENTTKVDNTNIDAPSVSTTVSGCLVLRAAREASGNSQTATWASGATEVLDPGGSIHVVGVAYDTTNPGSGATGTRRVTWSTFAGDPMGAVTVAIAPATGASQALAGTSTGTSTTTGATNVAHPLGGTSAGTSTTTGAANVVRPLGGTSAGTSTTTGAPSVTRLLNTTDIGTSTTTGLVGVSRPFSGTSAGTSTTTGATNVAHPLAATSAGTSTTTGATNVAHPLAATSAGTSTTTGAAIASYALGGTSAGTSTTTGSFIPYIPLAGSSVGVSTTTGAASVSRGLNANSAGVSTTVGAIRSVLSLTSVSAGTSTTIGAGSVTRGIGGSSAGIGTSAGVLRVIWTLTGSTVGVSSDSGALTVVGFVPAPRRNLPARASVSAHSTVPAVTQYTLASVSPRSSAPTIAVRTSTIEVTNG